MNKKICIILDSADNRNFSSAKQIIFEGLSLAMFRRRDFYNLGPNRKKALIANVGFTTFESAKKPWENSDVGAVIVMGRKSLALFEDQEETDRNFYKRIGDRLTPKAGPTVMVLSSTHNMVAWYQNPTHKASERGINHSTHYVRTAYQIMTDTVPLSTRTAVRFTLNAEDIATVCNHVTTTGYAAFDVETFPYERNVAKGDRLEHNTTFFRALCRTLQVSHQAGAAWTIPVYDFESPLNVGQADVLEFGTLATVETEDGESKIFTPYEVPVLIPEDEDIYVRRNGEIVTRYDWEELPFRREFAQALYLNWLYCKQNGVDNYFRDVCFPQLEEAIFNNPDVRKVAHNTTFDYNVLRYDQLGLGFRFSGILEDTMEQIHTLDKSKPKGLKPLSESYYPEFIGYGEDIDYENDSLYDIGVYGGTDTDLTARIDTFQYYQLLKEPKLLNFYLNVKLPNISFFGDMEYEGCYIDRTQLERTKEITRKKANIFLDKLNNIPEVQDYVRARIKKEREEALEVIEAKLSLWAASTLTKVEARIKKTIADGKAFKQDGTPYSGHAKDLAKKEWILRGIQTTYYDPKSPVAYKRAIDLQEERTAVQTGQAEKVYLINHSPSTAARSNGKTIQIDGRTYVLHGSKKELFRGMNYNSTDHLGDFVYLSENGLQNEMPVTTAKETDPETGRKRTVRKARPTTNRKEVTGLPDPTGFLETLIIYKALLYILQSCEEVEGKLDPRGYIHTQYGYTDTDRSTSSRPNLQNVMQRSPYEEVRECVKSFKSMFSVPDNNTAEILYYKRDLSQAELRWFCYVYRIGSMATAYDNDQDLHLKTAATIMGMDEGDFLNLPKHLYKQHRTEVGKGNNFGNIYGISAKGFQDYVRLLFNAKISIEEAERQQGEFFKLYPEILPAHVRQKKLIHEKGYSETPFGNRRQLPDLNSSIMYFQAEAERHGINQPVQGAAGVAMMFSGVIFKLRLKVTKLWGRTINLIHDDIPGYCRKDQSYRYQIELREACNRPPFLEYFGFEMDIARMKSDGEIGTNWAKVEELPDLIKEVQEKTPDAVIEDQEDVLRYLYPDQDEKFLKSLYLVSNASQ